MGLPSARCGRAMWAQVSVVAVGAMAGPTEGQAAGGCANATVASTSTEGETWQIVVTLLGLVAMLVAMALELAPADMLMMSMLIATLALGIVGVDEAFQGFSNTGMLTVAVLLIVAHSVRVTGAIDPIKGLLGAKGDTSQPLILVLMRLMLPVALLSAFMNNTPVVAMLIPVVIGFSNSNRFPASKMLIPLSYASILGGTCTLMGTSTNLVVYGLAQEKDPSFEMSLFEIGIVGLPVALAGALFVVVFGPRFLPTRESHFVDTVQGLTEYIVSLVVLDPSEVPVGGKSLVDCTVAEVDLCNVPGVSLVKIERQITSHHGASTIPNPNRDRVLRAGDQLFFAGSVHRMLDIAQGADAGLAFVFGPANTLQGTDCTLMEAKIGKQSRLPGHTLRELRFRQKYDASVIAVHRPGEGTKKRTNGALQPVGTFEIRRGDSLLLLAGPEFKSKYGSKHVTDFSSVIELSSAPSATRKAATATVLCVAMIGASIGGVNLLTAALVAAVFLINSGCLSTNDVYDALDLPVLVVIAAAFGISKAMINSGSAALIARGLVAASEPSGVLGLQVVIYLATVLFSAFVTNNAAVTIMFPIAYKVAEEVGVDFKPFMYLLMMGASASFMTPTGYQTNLMVHGPGGYRFTDFLKFGGLMQVWVGAVTITVMQTLEFWWLWSLLFLGLHAGVVLLSVRTCLLRRRAEVAFQEALDDDSPLRSPQRPVRWRSHDGVTSPPSLHEGLRDLNMRRGQRYTYVPDLGLVPIDDEYHDNGNGNAGKSFSPPGQQEMDSFL